MRKTSAPSRRASIGVRLGAFGVLTGALLLGGTPALAAQTISIDPDDVPTTAADAPQFCYPGGGPFPDEETWVFDLSGDPETSGVFQSLSTTFSTPGGTVTRPIPASPDSEIVDFEGVSRAFIRLPADWTLTGATAVISGTADDFVLAHTCAASDDPGDPGAPGDPGDPGDPGYPGNPGHPGDQQVSLSIDKKARVESDCHKECANDGFAARGDKIFYTYRVANTGTVKITDVEVDDRTAGYVHCNDTTLAPGTSTDCHAVEPYVVSWADVKEGKVVNTARATGKYRYRTVVSDPATVTICIRDGKFDHRKDDKDHKGGWDGKGGKPELPVTGDNVAQTLSLGGGLLAAGGLLVGLGRLRRKAHLRL
jgi:LPXTG-motif cell wall-anchored protein